jgi:YidC/Oxa1 family membrane protein insertase
MWSSFIGLLRATLFVFSHVCGGNVGFGIIALSVTARLALLPFTLSAARRNAAMRVKMKRIEPRIAELKARHRRDAAACYSAIQAEYRNEGINPVLDSGIHAAIVQAPIGIALYSVVRSGAAGASRFFWIRNIARPDSILAVIAGALALAAGLTTPPQPDVSQSILMPLAMSAVSCLVVLHLSAGVALYWASNTGVGILQNVLLRREMSRA